MDQRAAHQARADFAEYLRGVLIGPKEGVEEQFQGSPLLRYMMGMLFPPDAEVELASDGTDEAGKTADAGAEEGQGTAGDSIGASHRPMPSSVGLSFLVGRGTQVELLVSAALYEKQAAGVRGATGRGAARWKRVPLPRHGEERTRIDLVPERATATNVPVLGGRAYLHVNARTWPGGGHLVTATLVNAIERGSGGIDPSKVLFQTTLCVEVIAGEILPYPRPRSASASDADEAEVRYLYRETPVFARGHGAAAMWDRSHDGACRRAYVDFMPSTEVRQATFEIHNEAALDPRYRDVEYLATNEDAEEVQAVLSGLVAAFGEWLAEQEEAAREANEDEGSRLATRCQEWRRRMELGIQSLSEPDVFLAFRLANQAMYWQMIMSHHGTNGPYAPACGKQVSPCVPGYGFTWRPFQIAFFLGVIPSLLPKTSDGEDDLDVVDVIWFPTGGGKTEAYLLVAAFELVRRRLAYGDADQATAVLSRYTLRMLTTQQFQRTGTLISALELMRRQLPEKLGKREFTAGLWVGKDSTPNRFSIAVQKLEAWNPSIQGSENPFLLDRCPACATSIVDVSTGEKGVDCGPAHFKFRCLSPSCDFHDKIPMQVVDDALFQHPPSILLGTLDKFAGLTWDDTPRVFFGGATDEAPPPSLIIQDELHLISGPLGSICAPYEVGVDTIIRARTGGRGAKIIASTATIRNSQEQVRGIYGRESTIFPSPVRRWDDAFFFRLEDQSVTPGRLYLGAMGQGTTTPVVSMVWMAAALLQASAEVELPERVKDGYWTLLVYLNSRRELGRTITAASQEIPDRMKAIATLGDNVRDIGEIMELSSQMRNDMGDAIRTLQRRGTAAVPAVGLVPCTSIISVGVDVNRLGLMLVNGQPKLTSEYIQASSRVGRSQDAPGLVVALYSPAKPRDRSHYEDFRAYHESFYRFVEPTSVTPYAPPARKRTLHSALIAMIRHATPYRRNKSAGQVRFDDPVIARLVDAFRQRIRYADPAEADDASAEIDAIIMEWETQAAAGRDLYFTNPGRQFAGISASLVRDFGEPPAWGMYEAMRSVRNVDPDVSLKPVGAR